MANKHNMVYILSEDYWGFDASTKDDSANFYTNTWTLPKSQYDAMPEEDDRRKLFRCALFYVTDKTDNHGWTAVIIQSQGNKVVIAGKRGGGAITKRLYETGSSAGYSTGGIVMRQADPAATTFDELKDMDTNQPGNFKINDFIFDDEEKIKEKVESLQTELGQLNADTGSYASESVPTAAALQVSEPLAVNPSLEAASGSELITDISPSVDLFAETEMTKSDKLALKNKRKMESRLRAMNRRAGRKAKLGAETTANLPDSNLPAVPVVDNSFGQDSSLSSHGVPEWTGSAEMDQIMTTQAVGQAGADYDHEIHYRADTSGEECPQCSKPTSDKETTRHDTWHQCVDCKIAWLPDSDEYISFQELDKYHRAEGRKYGKRQRFDHIKGNSRYVARNAKGQFISNVGVGNSIRADLRNSAKSQQPVGFRNQGDAMIRRAEATPSVVDAAEPMDYQPYEFIDEMETGEYISSDDFMTLLAETVDGMALRYRPPMYRSPTAMLTAGVVLGALSWKLLKK